MEHIREYLVSVTAAALLVGIIRCLAGNKGLIHLISGIFLLLTLIRPITEISLTDMTRLHEKIQNEAVRASDQGEDYAEAAMTRHIKEQCQAYILDKANAFGAQIHADFTLNAQMVPEACTIQGEVTSYAKQQLSKILQSDLGIPREAQQWIP
jgi:uncharacterized protein YgbK (DUF1537 family)